MGARMNSVNPAKIKREVEALERNPRRAASRGPVEIRRRLSLLLLCLLSSFLLLISFAPFDYSPVAFFALVPWGLAVVGARKGRQLPLWNYLAGVAFWAAGVYWLTWMALPGYLAMAPYLAVYPLVAGLLVRRAFQRGVPVWVALPVVWVALEYARAFALSGFNWFGLEQTQYRWTRLLQICDVTGRYGVSFFVAMVNGAIIDVFARGLLARKPDGGARRAWKVFVGLGVCAAAGAGLLGYGTWRMSQKTTRPGPTFGIVQQAIPITLADDEVDENDPFKRQKDVFGRHINGTLALAKEEVACDWVIWPESMLGFRDLDPAYWREFDAASPDYTPEQKEIIQTYQEHIGVLNRALEQVGCPILAGGGMRPQYLKPAEGERLSTNSALLYRRDPDGRVRLAGRYDKMHLVPFGEYVPFREGWPAFHRLLRWFVPPVMGQLEPGREPVRFQITSRSGEKYTAAVAICFEGTFPRVCRQLVMAGGRKADVLVNITNDGWFIYGSGARPHASIEFEQHLAQYVFRAIECRVPVVRAVNTGISASIDSDGVIVETFTNEKGRRKNVAGNLVAPTVVDDRVSVYSQIGDVFALATCAAGLALAVAGYWPRRAGREKARKGRNAKK